MQTNSNREKSKLTTHEGGRATPITPIAQLNRTLMSCLLWEDGFYEDGIEVGQRIATLAHECRPIDVAQSAILAREQQHLRHVSLLLARELARHPSLKYASREDRSLIGKTIERVIQRADEIPEFLALYWKDGKTPIAKQVKRGLAAALRKFDEYQLAKYDRDQKAVRLRDVMFLTHPRPDTRIKQSDGETFMRVSDCTVSPAIVKPKYKRGDTKRHLEGQGALWYRLSEQKLKTPDTWEVALSAGADKRATFERLITEGKLGYLALLRNLRNMIEAGCSEQLVRDAIALRKGANRVLPFRFLAAAKHAPTFEPELDQAMIATLDELGKLPGRTLVLIDNSGSMYVPMSAKSDLQRADAAAGVAILARGISESARVFSFSERLAEVPPRTGMALRDAIQSATEHGGTYLGRSVELMNQQVYDRLIVITDEQSHDTVPQPKGRGYLINVASNRNGVGYGAWVHIDGWSEQCVRFIQEYEAVNPVTLR